MNTKPMSPSRRWLVVVLLLAWIASMLGIAFLILRQESSAANGHPTGSERAISTPRSTIAESSPAEVRASPPRILAPHSRRALQQFDYGYFRVGYDNERRAGAWGLYDLSGPIAFALSQPSRPTFRTESKSSARVTSKEYSNPGNRYERGHIVPSFAMWSRYGDEARQATFVMTNVFPQDGDLNGRLWEDIEDDIAGQVKNRQALDEGYAGRLRSITAIAGPVYGATPESLPSGIPIPEFCFYIIYDLDEATHTFRARAYLLPNRAQLSGPTSRYATTIRRIEEVTGLDFMPNGGPQAEALEVASPVLARW